AAFEDPEGAARRPVESGNVAKEAGRQVENMDFGQGAAGEEEPDELGQGRQKDTSLTVHCRPQSGEIRDRSPLEEGSGAKTAAVGFELIEKGSDSLDVIANVDGQAGGGDGGGVGPHDRVGVAEITGHWEEKSGTGTDVPRIDSRSRKGGHYAPTEPAAARAATTTLLCYAIQAASYYQQVLTRESGCDGTKLHARLQGYVEGPGRCQPRVGDRPEPLRPADAASRA